MLEKCIPVTSEMIEVFESGARNLVDFYVKQGKMTDAIRTHDIAAAVLKTMRKQPQVEILWFTPQAELS